MFAGVAMLRRYASALWLVVLLGVVTLSAAQVPNPGSTTGSPPATPKKANPDPPPLPPDVVAPDPPPPDTTQSGPVTRTLKKLAPNCINAVFHGCWSSPPQKPEPPQTAQRKGAASREVAEFYFDRGNYHAAESRFREALEYNPNDARAMFGLAQCLEKMNHINEALEEYRSCADHQPSSPYAERSRKAVQRLTEPSGAAVTH